MGVPIARKLSVCVAALAWKVMVCCCQGPTPPWGRENLLESCVTLPKMTYHYY